MKKDLFDAEYRVLTEEEVVARIKQLHNGSWHTLVTKVGEQEISGKTYVVIKDTPFTYGLKYSKYPTVELENEIREAVTEEQVKACRAKFDGLKRYWEKSEGYFQTLVPKTIRAELERKEACIAAGVNPGVTPKKEVSSRPTELWDGLSLKTYLPYEDKKGKHHDRNVVLRIFNPRRISIKTGNWVTSKYHVFEIVGDDVTELDYSLPTTKAIRDQVKAAASGRKTTTMATEPHFYWEESISKIIKIK